MELNHIKQRLKETDSDSLNRLDRLKSLTERASKLNQGALKEYVAVPSSEGGYVLEIREIKTGSRTGR